MDISKTTCLISIVGRKIIQRVIEVLFVNIFRQTAKGRLNDMLTLRHFYLETENIALHINRSFRINYISVKTFIKLKIMIYIMQ